MEVLDNYLKDCNFEKYYKKLVSKLKNKRIIVYGSGALFQHIKKKYDLSKFNIIGISDNKYILKQEGTLDLGYPIIPKSKLREYNPEVLLLGVQEYVYLLNNFSNEIFEGKNVKVIPLVRQPLLKILKKIWFKN